MASGDFVICERPQVSTLDKVLNDNSPELRLIVPSEAHALQLYDHVTVSTIVLRRCRLQHS